MSDSLDLFPSGRTERDYEAEFFSWWSTYPPKKNNPKAAARAVWLRLGKASLLPPLELMLAAGRAFAAHHKKEKTDPKFIPHARTFLHQQQFHDWIRVAPKPVEPPTVGADWADSSALWKPFKDWMVARAPEDWLELFAVGALVEGHDERLLRLPNANITNRITRKYEGAIESYFGRPYVRLTDPQHERWAEENRKLRENLRQANERRAVSEQAKGPDVGAAGPEETQSDTNRL